MSEVSIRDDSAAIAPQTVEIAQSPHTLRLLHLIRSGTLEHAQYATHQLARTSLTVDQTWDMMGRLQACSKSRSWKTRQNAQIAIRGIYHAMNSNNNINSQEVTLADDLTIQEVKDNLHVIASRARLLLARDEDCSSYYHQDGDLQQLDQQRQTMTNNDNTNFVQERMQLQRQILKQRLGLAAIPLTAQEEILQESLVEEAPTAKRQRLAQKQQQDNEDEDPESSLRVLLILESRGSSNTPQTLLASELAYRILDSRWYIRHGAILACMALSPCSESLLARCLCVLLLDRFVDYADPAVVAPVRQAAAQLVAVLVCALSESIQTTTMQVLTNMTNMDAWEIRHAAMIAVKFVMALVCARGSTARETKWTYDMAVLAANHLGDDSDDVKSVAAQVLCEYYPHHTTSPVWDTAVTSVWFELRRVNASCLVDLVSLFTVLVDGGQCVRLLHNENVADIARFLETLLDVGSLRVSAATCIQSLAKQLLYDQDQANAMASYVGLVKKVFASYFIVMEDDEDLFSDCRAKAWKALSESCGHVNQSDLLAAKSLAHDLVSIYFGINFRQINRVRDCFSSLVGAADALASFLKSNERYCDDHVARVVQIAINAFLHSPWSFQCEASCLLLRARSRVLNEPLCDAMAATLHELLTSKRAVCLKLHALELKSLLSVLSCNSVAEVCDEAYLKGVSSIGKEQGDFSLAQSTNAIVAVWSATFASHGLMPSEETRVFPTLLSTRVDAAISGALLFAPLPLKLTHLVRSLMTSVKNECGATDDIPTTANEIRSEQLLDSRQRQTCLYLHELVKKLEGKQQYAGASRKVLDNLCKLVAAGDMPSKALASCIVRSLFSDIDVSKTSLKAYEPVWDRISLLFRYTTSEDEESLVQAVDLLCVVGEGVVVHDHRASDEIFSFATALVTLACGPFNAVVKETCLRAMKILCIIGGSEVRRQCFESLLPSLQDRRDDMKRQSACVVMERLVVEAGVDICPFVRTLLPLVMSMMTDPVRECSKLAYKTFANLVRVAPLVQKEASLVVGEKSSDDMTATVDHLILGKPLPPSRLPTAIEESLAKNNIRLRDYQAQGVSWLTFLQSVNLNGALCDSMGLGNVTHSCFVV
jgi:hypothetical protein